MIDIKEILSPKTFMLFGEDRDKTNFDNIQINSIDCNLKSILFYNLNTNKDIEQFESRLNNCTFGICFINFKDKSLKRRKNLCYVEPKDWDEFIESTLKKIYPVNWNNLSVVGFTGTNGKTTSVHLVSNLLCMKKINVVTVGTIGITYNGKVVKNLNATSPSQVDNWKLLFEYSNQKTVFAFEVSSHALVQNRFCGIKFDSCGWTSFSQDHLDYHNTMEEYFQAKLRILDLLTQEGKLFLTEESKDIQNYLKSKNDKIETVPVYKSTSKNLFLSAKFNRINISLTQAVLKQIGITITEKELDSVEPPPGRYNIFEIGTNIIVVDYAHTPDAIENIVSTLKIDFADKKLVIVFGCGGNRDKSKRALMAKAASEFSDQVIITSDNPRFEDPNEIIKDIEPGIVKGKNYKTIVDRKEAITYALSKNSDSVILIAGKGHEDYLDIQGKKIPYSDIELVKGFRNAGP